MKTVRVSERVVYCDTDCGGVVSNIAYLRFVEKARCELFDSLGLPLAETVEKQLFPAVVRTEIDYRRPARLGDLVEVEAAVERVEKARVFCGFRLFRGEEGGTAADGSSGLFAAARQTVALVRLPSGRPARVPQEWRE